MVYIYKITNKLNNKVYIGKTCQLPETRWRQHLTGMGLGKKMPIHLALNKYKPENFNFEVIYICFEDKYSGYAEIFFINYFNCLAPNGYNVDFNTKCMKDNPYLIEESKESSAVQSIDDEPAKADYNSSTRTRYPFELWCEIKLLYLEGKCPKDINSILETTIAHRTMLSKLKALGCDTSNKTRNKIRGNGKYFITDSEKLLVVSDFNNGLTVVQLQKKYKRANRVIRQILVQANLYISSDKKICRTA